MASQQAAFANEKFSPLRYMNLEILWDFMRFYEMLKHVEATSMLFLGAHELKHDSPAPPYWTDLSRMATLRDKFYKPTCRHCCLFQISYGIAYCSHFSLDLASFSLGISSLKLSFSWVFLEFFFSEGIFFSWHLCVYWSHSLHISFSCKLL